MESRKVPKFDGKLGRYERMWKSYSGLKMEKTMAHKETMKSEHAEPKSK